MGLGSAAASGADADALRAAKTGFCAALAVFAFAGFTSSSQTSICQFPVRLNYESVVKEAQALIDFRLRFLLLHRIELASGRALLHTHTRTSLLGSFSSRAVRCRLAAALTDRLRNRGCRGRRT